MRSNFDFALFGFLMMSLQCTAAAGASSTSTSSSYRSLGAVALVRDRGYAGADRDVDALPFVGYASGRWEARGNTVSFRVAESHGLGLYAIGAAYWEGIDAGDFGARELAARGIDRRRLVDRDDSLDVGASVAWRTAYGEVALQWTTDVADASGGDRIELSYQRPFQIGRATLTPSLGVVHYDATRADYYYGIHDREIARGVAAYRPGAATFWRAGLGASWALTPAWSLIADVEYRGSPDEIRDSPLVDADHDGTVSLAFGVARSF